jgi:hypothetical protein
VPEQKTEPKLPFFRNGIWQVALLVEDLDKAVEAYWKLFGIGPWHIYTYARPLVKDMTYRGAPADYEIRLALAQVGPMQLELIQPLAGDSLYAEAVEEQGYGLHHLAVLVDDMQSAAAQAQTAGLDVVLSGRGYGLDGDGGYAYLDTEGELGTILELVEVPARRAEPESTYPPSEGSE